MAQLAFLNCPPLASPELPFLREAYNLQLCLDQPLIRRADARKLVSLCALADVMLERCLKVSKYNNANYNNVLLEIEQSCKECSASKSTQVALEEMGLLDMFPYLGQLMGKKAEAEQHAGNTYLLYTSLMNQVLMLANQLFHDSTVPQHHKYSAHQIALLYQSLNMLQGETKPIRKLIEEKFEDIKVITESKQPVLPSVVCDWLQEVTSICRDEVKACPAYMHKRLERMSNLVQRKL